MQNSTKQKFLVANNLFSVTVPDTLYAWKALQPRFEPFETASDSPEVLRIRVQTGPVVPSDAKLLYEPQHAEIGLIESRILCNSDRQLVIEFKHIGRSETRMQITMSRGFDEADILLMPTGQPSDTHFLSHAVMVAYMLATCAGGTLTIHSSAVIYDGRAYLFQGKSGTGKSTHARMWLQNIPGATLLNDDNPMVRIAPDGTAVAYGSPWSGKTDCYKNQSAPVAAFVRIVRSPDNSLHRLAPLQAYASLTSSTFNMPYMPEALREKRHRAIERLVQTVPCCNMHCRPDADAAKVCMATLNNTKLL